MDALRLLSRSTGLKAQTARTKEHTFPSEGPSTSPVEAVSSRKRKRGDDDSLELTDNDLSPEAVRNVQRQHKIRIVNLQKIREARHGGAETSRKRVKEEARLFPQPLTDFSQLHSRYQVNNALSSNIADQGYYEPTEVQIAIIPLLLDDLEKRPNLLTVAPTGSGKTLAFLLPLIEKLSRQRSLSREAGKESRLVRALILAPTKELVNQIVNEGRKLCNRTGLSITAIKKGMTLLEGHEASKADGPSDEDGEADRASSSQDPVKADILVSTPLTALHAISGSEKTPLALPLVETLILDEADVLLDPLFRQQTLAIWSALTSPQLRVSLWSATVGSNIEDLAISTIAERRQTLGIKQRSTIVRTVIGLKDSSLPSISHKLIYAATEPGKLLGLRQLLHPARKSLPASKSASTETEALRPPFLIFTQTIDRATALFQELQYDIPAAAGGSSRIAVLHSSLSTTSRSDIIARFRKGEIWILITTDLLSRGVDFKGVNGVVNYDIPTTSAAYVHRAGRTGRAGRSGGICVTLYTREDVKYLNAIASVIQASQKVSDSTPAARGVDLGLEKWILDALPELKKKDRHELKQRGVETRRGIKDSDTTEERKVKRNARIGTKSGYDRQLESRRTGAVEGSKRRKRQDAGAPASDTDDDWHGFD
jgi:ATP-dependent RNA helicase DDX52/ROK1